LRKLPEGREFPHFLQVWMGFEDTDQVRVSAKRSDRSSKADEARTMARMAIP
jgi:hypothetical protein